MRITNSMLGEHFLYNYNSALNRVSTLNDQISSGKSINKPSDDPVKAARALMFHTSSDVNDMLTQGVGDALSWMTTSDSSMQTVVTDLSSIKTLLVQANTPSPQISFAAIATNIDGLINDIVSAANAQVGDRYIFSGQADHTTPYTYDTATSKWVYNGTYNDPAAVPPAPAATAGTITMKVSPGATNPTRDKVNTDGLELFGAGTSGGAADPAKILNDLEQIKAHLTSANPQSFMAADLQTVENHHNNVLTALTTLGARQSVYETIQSRLKIDTATITKDLSDNEDLNVSKASIDFQIAQNTYNAALSMGAKVLPQSLVDYLK